KTPPPLVHLRRAGTPVELSRFLNRMLAKDPKDRPASCEVVADTLTPFATGHQLPAATAAVASAMQRTPLLPAAPARKRGGMAVVVWVGLAAVLAGVSLIAIALMGGFRTAETIPSGPPTAQLVELQPSKTLPGLPNWVRSMAFSPDGKVLA